MLLATSGKYQRRECQEYREKHISPTATILTLFGIVQVNRGVLFTSVEAEGRRQKNPFDTITEGVGLNRLTANFDAALIDSAVKCSDREAVEMVCALRKCKFCS